MSEQHSAALWLTSTLRDNVVNELRASFARLETNTNSDDPSSEEIPSLEINELGLVGFNAAANRTAIGLAVNLPQFRNNNTWQVQDSLSYLRGNHSFKAGFDLRRIEVESFFNPTIRGRLVYPTLQRFVDDVARRGHHQRPPPRWGARGELRVERRLLLRPGRVAHPAHLHPEPRRALRAAGELHRQPRGAEPADRGRGRAATSATP